jgi:hypothetical protein
MSSIDVQNFLQLKYPPSHWGSFDTLQIINNIKIPFGEWNTTRSLEPIINTLPQYGTGGGTQGVTNKPINLRETGVLR